MTDRLAELEARVQRVEDREAIHGLFMRYRECLDEKDFSGYAALFASGRRVRRRRRIREGPRRDRGAGRRHARQPADGRRRRRPPHRRQSRDLDRRRPRDRPLDLDLPRAGRRRRSRRSRKVGHYEDELVREDGEWRFARRFAPMDMPAD